MYIRWRRRISNPPHAISAQPSAKLNKGSRLGDLPLVTLTAPEKCMHGWLDLQKELSEISERGRHVVVDGSSHITILTNRDHAKRVADEVAALI